MAAVRVLVVDAYKDNADLLASLLVRWGHDAKAVYCGSEVVEMVVIFLPHVILLDLVVPVVDCFAVAKLVREHPSLN